MGILFGLVPFSTSNIHTQQFFFFLHSTATMGEAQYITGDKGAIEQFVDQFDVRISTFSA
jgi:hypothetical protein